MKQYIMPYSEGGPIAGALEDRPRESGRPKGMDNQRAEIVEGREMGNTRSDTFSIMKLDHYLRLFGEHGTDRRK